MARALRESADLLLEASERAYELRFEQLSTELLERSVELVKLARDLLELDSERSPTKRKLNGASYIERALSRGEGTRVS